MEQKAKPGRTAVYIGCYLAVLSLVTIVIGVRAVRSIRKSNQMRLTYSQIQPLTDKSVELSRQINAELWAAIKEAQALAADAAKPLDQRPSDLEQRRQLNQQRMEGIAELLTQQQRILEQIGEIQKQKENCSRTENSETKAVLEKF